MCFITNIIWECIFNIHNSFLLILFINPVINIKIDGYSQIEVVCTLIIPSVCDKLSRLPFLKAENVVLTESGILVTSCLQQWLVPFQDMSLSWKKCYHQKIVKCTMSLADSTNRLAFQLKIC